MYLINLRFLFKKTKTFQKQEINFQKINKPNLNQFLL